MSRNARHTWHPYPHPSPSPFSPSLTSSLQSCNIYRIVILIFGTRGSQCSNFPTRENPFYLPNFEFEFQFTLIRFAYLGWAHQHLSARGGKSNLDSIVKFELHAPSLSHPSRWLRNSVLLGPRPYHSSCSTTRAREQVKSFIQQGMPWAPARSVLQPQHSLTKQIDCTPPIHP